MRKKILTGQNFGKWTVLCEDSAPKKDAKARWICECECGVQRSVDGYSLRSGGTKGCGGCYKHEPTNTYKDTENDVIIVHCVNAESFIINSDDLPLVNKYQWHINNRGYVVSGSVKHHA